MSSVIINTSTSSRIPPMKTAKPFDEDNSERTAQTMKDDSFTSSQLHTIQEDEALQTSQQDNDLTIQSLHHEPKPKQAKEPVGRSSAASNHKNDDDDDDSTSCISFACIIRMLCEDPDKPQEGAADKYRSGLSEEFASAEISTPKAYRMKSLDDSGRFIEDDDEWESQGFPKSYSMRASSCY